MGKALQAARTTVERGWKPTRKWIAAQVAAVVGLAIMLLTGDSAISDPEIVAIGTYVVQAATTYLLPNGDTPGGVPDARAVPEPAVMESGTSHMR